MAASWAEALLAVQSIDLRIKDLETRLTLFPVEKKKLVDRHLALTDKLDRRKEEIKAIELEIRKKESEVEALGAASAKLQQQSALVKKNNEYQAMLAEIAANQAKAGDIETNILGLYDRLDEIKTVLKKETAEAAAENRLIKTEYQEFDELEKEIHKEIALQQSRRQETAAQVTENLMEQYRQLSRSKDGMPLAPVENDICGNCFLKLTPQTMTQARNGAVTRCDNCNHLVYIADL